MMEGKKFLADYLQKPFLAETISCRNHSLQKPFLAKAIPQKLRDNFYYQESSKIAVALATRKTSTVATFPAGNIADRD